MCKAFEDMRLEGYEAGKAEGIRILIQACQELGVSKEVIVQKCADKYEIALESAAEYAEIYCV